MSYNIERFIKAQEYSYAEALKEIQNGHKESHWIWYIFPQLKQLGRSSTAQYYGIENLEEATEYLAHPILGFRLREICEALLSIDRNNPYQVMGGIDALKLRSSMTLFAEIEGYNSVFGKVLNKYYNGERDENTIRLLLENTEQ